MENGTSSITALRVRKFFNFSVAPGVVCFGLFLVSIILPLGKFLPLLALAACILLTAYQNKEMPALHSAHLLAATPTAFFLFSVAISIVLSENPAHSFSLSAPFLPTLVMFLGIVLAFSRVDLEHLCALLSLTALVMAIIAILFSLTLSESNPSSWIRSIKSPLLITPNDLSFLSVVTPFSVALISLSDKKAKFSYVAIISLLASVAAVSVFNSRGATFSMIAGIFFTEWLLKKTPKLTAIAVLLVIALDTLHSFLFLQRLSVTLTSNDASLVERTKLWRIAWDMFITSPSVGHGMHTYMLHQNLHIPWAHNLYLEVLAEQGVLGFISLLATLLTLVTLAYRARHSQDKIKLASGIFGATIAFSLTSFVELSFLRLWVAIVFFLAMGIGIRLCDTAKISG